MGNTPKQTENVHEHEIYGKTSSFVVNGEKFHTVSFPIKEEQDSNRFIKQFNMTDNFNKKHLLLSSNFTSQKAGLCGNSQLLNCTFPFFPLTLQKQIQSRKTHNKYLSKQQLTNLSYQIISGARNFDRIDLKVGDIRPGKILLNQTKNHLKLLNHFSNPTQQTGYQLYFQQKQKSYLSPEELRLLEKNITTPEINLHKADAFSLGLTILAAGNLRKIQEEFYDWTNFTFSWTRLSIQLENFQARYGHFLAEIVKAFLHNQPRNRLYIGQVGAILQFYEKHIYEFLDFQPDYLLMQKSYEVNYSGLRSEYFSSWLLACRNYGQQPIMMTEIKSRVLMPPTPVRQSTVVNSNIRFTYSSPKQVKSSEQIQHKQ